MSSETRAAKRADRIRNEIPILQVLADFGYPVHPGGGDREQQFSCDLHGDGRDSKPSARVYPTSDSWYCVSVNERVLTEAGWLRLDDIRRRQGRFSYGFEYLGHYPDSSGPRTYGCSRCQWVTPVAHNPQELAAFAAGHDCPKPWAPAMSHSPRAVLDGNSAWERPTAYLLRGVREVVRVQTKAGYRVVVTPDHEIEVVGKGWVQAGDLQPGDVLVVPTPDTPRFAEQVLPLPVTDLNDQVYQGQPPLQLPSEWSLELGEALGYVFGDGWVVPRQKPSSGVVGLTAHASDVEDARRIFSHMKKWAAGRGSEVHRTDIAHVNGKEYIQDQFVFSIGNDGFCEFFRRMGLDKSEASSNRRLPESIWEAPECGVRGFLRGIYGADGSAFRSKGRKGIKVNLYSVSVEFLRDVQLLLLQFGIRSRLYAPSNTRDKTGKRTHPAAYLQLATGKDICRFRERVGIASQRKQVILDSYEYNLRGSRSFKPVVESVEPAGRVEVADLSMPVEHSFVAGGIKVHNCFACGISRDAIRTTREKEGVGFWEACRRLEQRYHLPTLPWEEDEADPTANIAADIQASFKSYRTFEQETKRVKTFLDSLTEDKDLPLTRLLAAWEAFDRIVYLVGKELMKERVGKEALLQLRHRLLERLKEANEVS